MAKRKGSVGVRKRRVRATEQKITSSANGSSASGDSNSTSVAKESPLDWLASIQTDHITSNKNVKENVQTPLLLESIENGLTSDSITPGIQLDTSSQDDYEIQIDSIEEDLGADQAGACESPIINGFKTNRFYGSKLKSYKFSFQKSSLKSKNETKTQNIKLKNEEKKEKCRSVKRKQKVPQDQESVNHVVKKAKKDIDITTKDKVFQSNQKDHKVKGLCIGSNKEIRDKEKDRMDNTKNDTTFLDIITPESSSSSSPVCEDPLCSVTASNIVTNGFHQYDNIDSKHNNRTIDPKISISDTKVAMDEEVSELGSLQSEDSITSGLGSVRAGYLLKSRNNECYFSSASETSPDLSVHGPSKFLDTPKSSSTSADLDTESEASCTNDISKPAFLYYDKNASDSSYSPSGSSASHISPEHQTSITSFFKKSTKQISIVTSPKSKKPERTNRKGKERKKKMEQMYLDLGQKDFGHVTCTTCGMVYTHAQPDDEIEHIRHHKKFVNGLRFNGWKDEHVVKEFHDGRIIMVKPDDRPSRLKKVEEIRKVVDSELGFAVDLPYRKNESKTFLFIANKRVVGCCVATQIDKGYPVLPSTPSKDSTPDRQIAAWCCSTIPVPAQCGISKIWVWNQYRRKKVATRLIDCVRSDFIYGCTIAKEALAFSDPTPDGKRLASTYVGTQEFLVFR